MNLRENMTEKTLSEKLRLLANHDLERSKSARLRDVYNDVEFVLAAGVSKEKILKQLAEDDLIFILDAFNTTLYRIRTKQKGTTNKTKSIQKPVSEKTNFEPVTTEPEIQVSNSGDPRSLTKIFQDKPDLKALAKLAKQNKGTK